jgi:hypothetical protein
MLRHVLRCDCGTALHVGAGQAGLSVPCYSCGRRVPVPPLSSLRRLPAVKGVEQPQRPAQNPFQFGIRHLLVLTLCWAIVLAAGRCIGFHSLAVMIGEVFCSTLGFLGVIWLILSLRRGLRRYWDFVDQVRDARDHQSH